MDAQRFIAEFGHIVNAPGGVVRLREMIYQLAVTGALAPETEIRDDAASLLAEVAHNRERLVKAKEYKRLVELESEPICPPSSIDLPRRWRWTRLLDVGEINPRNDGEDNQLAAFLPMSGVPQVHRGKLVAETRPWREIKKGYTHFALGDVVLAKITPCFENGKAAVVTDLPCESAIGAGTTELHVFRSIHPGILPEFIYFYLRSPLFSSAGKLRMTGTAGQKRLPTEYFATQAVPLPPTAEQACIVARVDELMALLDKLEAQQKERRRLQNALRQSTLQAVAAATSPDELQTSSTRLDQNFGRLFSAPEDIAELRSFCAELAIRGEIVPTDNRIDENEVDRLVSQLTSSKRKGNRTVRQRSADDPFILPANWRWVRFEDLLVDSESGWSPQCEAETRRPGEWGVLKVSAVTWGEFRPEENKRLPLSLEPRFECEVKPQDFLLSRANTAELVARSVIAPLNVPPGLLMSDKIIRLNFIDPDVKPWANLVNNSLYAREYYRRYATGTSDSMRNVSRQVIHELPIPLPPKSVQEAILGKLTQLEHWCRALQDQLAEAQQKSEKLVSAVVGAFTGITMKPEEEPVKIPETEIIAPLRLGTPPSVNNQSPLATLLARHNGELSARDLWQRFGGEIDAFYAQLKTEVAHGWIQEPSAAEAREKPTEATVA
jgi:type I restriction enzyme S subunit